ncbi:MAG: hypothetical protein ACREM1_00390 [Longimicrobiales bacterium]
MSYRRTGLIIIAAMAACKPQPNVEGAIGAQPTDDAWSVRIASGVVVRVRPQATPVREGPVTFLIELDPPPAEELQVSVDLVSPTMPAHGINRYDAQRQARNRYRAVTEIPMAGDWNLYVNLGNGETAAEFSFEVVAADGAAPAAHGAHEAHADSHAPDAGDGTHPTPQRR